MQRKDPYPESYRMTIGFMDDPLQLRKFHIPEKHIVLNIRKKSKDNKVKLKVLWDDNKQYFHKIWSHLSEQHRDIFISSLLKEMYEILEPFATTTRDMKAMIMPCMPLSCLLGDMREGDEKFGSLVQGYISSADGFASGPPVCRAVKTDAPSIGVTVDTSAMPEAEQFVEALREFAFSMFLIQVALIYKTLTHTYVFIVLMVCRF